MLVDSPLLSKLTVTAISNEVLTEPVIKFLQRSSMLCRSFRRGRTPSPSTHRDQHWSQARPAQPPENGWRCAGQHQGRVRPESGWLWLGAAIMHGSRHHGLGRPWRRRRAKAHPEPTAARKGQHAAGVLGPARVPGHNRMAPVILPGRKEGRGTLNIPAKGERARHRRGCKTRGGSSRSSTRIKARAKQAKHDRLSLSSRQRKAKAALAAVRLKTREKQRIPLNSRSQSRAPPSVYPASKAIAMAGQSNA